MIGQGDRKGACAAFRQHGLFSRPGEKGQIFSIDFVISILLLTVAIALLLQYAEFGVYSENSAGKARSIAEVANAISNRIVLSPDFCCTLLTKDINAIEHLPNCIDIPRFTTGELWAPSDYKYHIKLGDSTRGELTIPDYKDYFTVVRKVVIFEGGLNPLKKEYFENCKSDPANCILGEGELKVTVWLE